MSLWNIFDRLSLHCRVILFIHFIWNDLVKQKNMKRVLTPHAQFCSPNSIILSFAQFDFSLLNFAFRDVLISLIRINQIVLAHTTSSLWERKVLFPKRKKKRVKISLGKITQPLLFSISNFLFHFMEEVWLILQWQTLLLPAI